MRHSCSGGLWRIIGIITALAGSASAANAQDDAMREIEQLREALQRTNSELSSVKTELDTLKAQSNEDWMTRQRVEEIKTLVAEVVADADTRTSLLQDSLAAGWVDHFFLASPDGRFKLQMDGHMQMRFMYGYHDDFDRWTGGFENSRTRLTFRGHVFNRDLQYLVRGAFDRFGGDFGGNFRLEDAWVRFNLDNEQSLRIGQFKVPFNREELVSSQYQLAVERSLVNESLNLGRSQGIEYTYTNDTMRFKAMTGDGATDNIGGFGIISPGGDPQNSPALDPDVEYTISGRFEYKLAGTWSQFEDFTSPPGEPFAMMFGVAGHTQKGEHGEFNFSKSEETWYAYTGDLSIEWGGASGYLGVVAANTFGPVLDTEVYGFVGQLSYYFTPNVEAYVRYEWGRFEATIDQTFDGLNVATFGFNYYFEPNSPHAAKLTADVSYGINEVGNAWESELAGFQIDDDGADPQIVFRVQFQLLF